MVSGVSLTAYWTSNLFMDYCKHLIPAIFCILMSLAFNIEAFTGKTDSFVALSLLFFLYGWSAINFSYLLGFLFRSYGNA
jgi:ATP-binding cassette, subfamily A (ABC1), member 3